MELVLALSQILSLLGPIVIDIIKALRRKDIRSMAKDLTNAKSPQEKVAIAHRIAAKLYHPESETQ